MQNLITRSNQPSLWNNLSGVTATDNVAIAPDGTLTAGRVVATGGGGVNHFAEQTNTAMPQPGANYARVKTSSVFVRADTTTKAVVGNGRHSNWYRALLDLSNGVVEFTENCKASLRYVGNGWWRCAVTYVQLSSSEANATQESVLVAPVPAAQTGTASVAFSQAGEAVFVWGAQLSLTSGPTVFVPTGAKIVEGRARRLLPWQNLVAASEDVSQWTQSAGTTVTSNVGLAPDGTMTADRVQWTAGALNTRYVSPSVGAPAGFPGVFFKDGVYTVSAWVRSFGASATVRLRLPLVPGVSNQDSSDIAVGPAWRRVKFTARVTLAGSGLFTSVFLLHDSAGSAQDFYVWGLQVTESKDFAEYTPTKTRGIDEGAPRGEVVPVQLALDTEDLTTARWATSAQPTRTLLPGQGLGRFNATRLNDQNAGAYEGSCGQFITIPVDQRAYTVSIDVAKTSSTPAFGFNLTLTGGTTQSMTPRVRPSDGALSQAWFSSAAWAYVEDLGTHWRLHGTIINNGTNTLLTVIFYAATGTVYTADSVNGTGYADVGRVSITATRGPVDYVPNGATASPYLGNARGRRLAQNLLQISNLNAWNVGGASRSVGPVFPGGRTGIKLTEDATAGVAHYTDQTIVPSWLTGRRVTVCIKARQGSGDRPWVAIGGNGGNVSGWLDMSTGTTQNPSPGCETRARQLVDGSWLLWFTFNSDATLPIVRFYMAASYGAAVYAGNGTSFVYFADAQLAETSGEPDFFESTRAVQGAVNEGLGGPRRRIGRQNTITAPNDFASVAWSKSQATIVSNVALAPNGTMTADRLVDNANNSLHYVTQAIIDPLAVLGGNNPRGMRTWSVFAKADTMSGFLLAVDNTNQGAYFDLALGVVALPFCAPGGFAECRRVTSDGWFLCSVTTDTSIAGAINPLFGTSSDPYAPIGAYVGSGTGVLIWGAQCAAGMGVSDYVDQLVTAEGIPRGRAL